MKRNYIRINRNILSSWVFADPVNVHVFLYLLLQADPDTGKVKNTQADMAKFLRMPRVSFQRVIGKLETMGTIKTLKVGRQIKAVTICNYAVYQGLTSCTWAADNKHLKERKEKGKKNISPDPSLEERKDKRKTLRWLIIFLTKN